MRFSKSRSSRARMGTAALRPRGFVLVAILVVVVLASMVAMSLLFRVNAEQTATSASTGGDQAWAAAMSGIQEALRAAQASVHGSEASDVWDNPSLFRERLIYHDGADAWYFSVFAPSSDELRGDPRFGLADEAGKVNLNLADASMLGKLPRMAPLLIDAALDFIDSDNTPRSEGAEQEYYDALPQPYLIRNGPLETLDELLLVRGFNPTLLYGEDANLNFRLDPNEDDGEEQFPPDNKDGRLDMGLVPFLTVSTYEPNVNSQGFPRLNINEPAGVLPDDLPSALTNYLAVLRQHRLRLSHPAELLEAKGKFKLDGGAEIEVQSGVGKMELAMVLDRFSADTSTRLTGLINVNTAPMPVLQSVGGIDELLAESIISSRRSLALEQQRSIAWLYQEGLVDAAKFKEIAPRLTARSFQFSFKVVGYGVPSGRYRVLDVGIDVAGNKPAITRLRDITRLGLPFPIDTQKSAPSTSPMGQAKLTPAGRLNAPGPRNSGAVPGRRVDASAAVVPLSLGMIHSRPRPGTPRLEGRNA